MPQDQFSAQDQFSEGLRMLQAAASANRDRVAHDPWGDMPEERRRQWTLMMVDFPPRISSVMVMHHQAAGTISPLAEWAHTARRFEAAGFTPQQFHWLHTCLRVVLGDEPHPLVTRSDDGRSVQVDPFVWERWRHRVEAGGRPLAVTRRVLSIDG